MLDFKSYKQCNAVTACTTILDAVLLKASLVCCFEEVKIQDLFYFPFFFF